MIRNDYARHVKLADLRQRQKDYSLAERKAQAEKRVVNRDRLGLPKVAEEITSKDVIAAPIGCKSAESKAFGQTKTDPKSSEYRYDDNGQLVRRFTDGYGSDPWQLVSERAVKALPDTRTKFAPSGKPAIKWRKATDPVCVVKVTRKAITKP
jgi:hypothetical protein